MRSEPAILVLLRETLEREAPGMAASLLFEALGRWGPRVPVSFVEIVDFTHGPLRACMHARLGGDRTTFIVRAIERALRLAEMPTGQLQPVTRSFDQEPTKSFARVEGPFVLAIVASTTAVATQLSSVLDPSRVCVEAITTLDRLARRADRVHVALVDATDPLPIQAHVLAAALARVSLVLVWGSEERGAATLVEALERASVRSMAFASDEADPLMDVLRSRAPADRPRVPWH